MFWQRAYGISAPASNVDGTGSCSWPSAMRERHVVQRPRPPHTDACGMPAERLASSTVVPRGTTTRLPSGYINRTTPLRRCRYDRIQRPTKTLAAAMMKPAVAMLDQPRTVSFCSSTPAGKVADCQAGSFQRARIDEPGVEEPQQAEDRQQKRR